MIHRHKRSVFSMSGVIIITLMSFGCGSNKKETEELKTALSAINKEHQLLLDKTKGADSIGGYPPVKIESSEVRQLHSLSNNLDYDIYIHYPNHPLTGKKYPTLYVLDAEVNFGAVCYIVQRLTKDGLIPEILVVGIAYPGDFDEDNYYSRRALDLTPTVDKKFTDIHPNLKAGSGGAPKFTEFITKELFPFVESNFPADSNGRTLYGHSLGGFFGFYTLLNHSDLFDNYLLLSPSLWWDKQQIFSAQNQFKLNRDLKVYVATGELEKDLRIKNSMVDDQIEMVKMLKRNNASGLSLKAEILKNETHRTIFGPGVTNGLRFLFAKK